VNVLGIDIGGSGIKGAVVNVSRGRMVTERFRVATPSPAQPASVGRALKKVVTHFGWKGPIGVGFPGIVRRNVALSAANLGEVWIGRDLAVDFSKATGSPVYVLNDADAAGYAELKFGAGRGSKGTVLLLTLGTGIGSALFFDGVLVPNLEFGHLHFGKSIAERFASASVREREKLSWKRWGKRLNELLGHYAFVTSADLIILGGGVSKKFDKFGPCIDLPVRVIPARLKNEAGIIGAAVAASSHLPKTKLKVRSFVPPETED
jgi:polyphosphate glucokinase